jgi:predicted esterase
MKFPHVLLILAAMGPQGLNLAAQPRFELKPIAAPTLAGDVGVAPWLSTELADWNALVPQYSDAAKPAGNQIKAWVAVTNKKILLHVVVTDDIHFNDRHGGDIWDGDNLQIGIDALGDGAGADSPDSTLVGPDDIELAAALGADGETLWAHYHGRAGGEGLMPKEYRTIVRDEKTKTTTYDLRIPWSELQAAAGASPVIGVRILNNDRDAPGGARTGLNWGNGNNLLRPGLFNRLRLAAPPGELVQFGQSSRYLWHADDGGEIPLYIASDRGFDLKVTAGTATHTFRLPAGADRLVRRFAIRYFPGALPAEPVDLVVSVMDGEKIEVATGRVVLQSPAAKVAAVRGRLEQLALAAGHPLLARHWRSIAELVAVEWAGAMAQVKDKPAEALLTLGYIDQLAALLEKEPGNWSDYSRGGRSLVLAVASSYDRSLQPYQLRLAENWAPARAYPMIVDLHGSGNDHTLSFVLGALQPPQSPAADDPPPAPAVEPYVTIMPWGRGNRGYMHVAERDVWDAMDDAAVAVSLDPDRYYLTGFSMGGGGTWNVGLRNPDRWAALCIGAGGMWDAPPGTGLAGNVSYLPVRIAHGTADGAVPIAMAYAMQAELKQYGLEANMRIIEGLGHTQPAWLVAENVIWMLKFRRKRPAEFSFVSDMDEHAGAWGVFMMRDVLISPLPRFTCTVKGNTVRLRTQGTKMLQVNLGPGGLGLEGEVIVTWNDQEAYRGPVKILNLSEPPPR